MLKQFVYRMIAGVSTFCLVHAASTVVYAQENDAQVSSAESNQLVDFLLPLDARTIEIESQPEESATVAHRINVGFAIARTSPTEPAGLALDSLPIIGDLIDAEGNFDWGIDLPVSFNLGNVEGETGLVLSTDFVMD